tara:strand:- start:186 stop:338 length:153 start_codon:yes stop_codon:yes gene_type:complete
MKNLKKIFEKKMSQRHKPMLEQLKPPGKRKLPDDEFPVSAKLRLGWITSK